MTVPAFETAVRPGRPEAAGGRSAGQARPEAVWETAALPEPAAQRDSPADRPAGAGIRFREKRSPAFYLQKIGLKYGILIIILSFWEISGRTGLADQRIVPSLSASLKAIYDMQQKIHFSDQVFLSLGRVVLGLIIGLSAAVPMAYVLARLLPGLSRRLDSLLRIFGLINPYCLFPVFVVMFGLGEAPKTAVLSWVCLWPVFFSSRAAFENTDADLLKTARSLGCRRWTIFCRLTLPASLPSIFNGLRLGVEMAFFILIAAEMTGAAAGLGWIVHTAGAAYQTDRLYGAGLSIVLLGILLNRCLILIRRGFLPWSDLLLSPQLPFSRFPPEPVSRAGLYFWTLILVLAAGRGLWQIFRNFSRPISF
jgi:NitT/TauT family transport system permease protein